MAWEENPRICLHMQLIAILSRTGVSRRSSKPFSCELPKSSERKTCKKHRVGRGEKLKIKGFMRVKKQKLAREVKFP